MKMPMKVSTATFSLVGFIMITAALAQDGRTRSAVPPTAPTPTLSNSASAAKSDPKVLPAETVVPGPTPADELKPSTLVLPTGPLEPWLLTKDAGPFMVMAKIFRGPEAERYALALAIELRRDHGLPTYILRLKDFPMRSNFRNVPPMAPSYVKKAHLTEPEKTRTYDEAAVLVGNEKTLADSEALLQRVKKIKPNCLNQVPSIFKWREGLSTAVRTTNPYVPTQDLFPGRTQSDPLVKRINGGPRSVFKCPGRYSLQVIEFSGRSVYNPSATDPRLMGDGWFKKSPLATAAADAERLADLLGKDPQVRQTGCQPYVYHDLTSSKVLIGSFNSPNDPAALRVRETLLRIAGELSAYNKTYVIAPATMLTDLDDPNHPIKMR